MPIIVDDPSVREPAAGRVAGQRGAERPRARRAGRAHARGRAAWRRAGRRRGDRAGAGAAVRPLARGCTSLRRRAGRTSRCACSTRWCRRRWRLTIRRADLGCRSGPGYSPTSCVSLDLHGLSRARAIVSPVDVSAEPSVAGRLAKAGDRGMRVPTHTTLSGRERVHGLVRPATGPRRRGAHRFIRRRDAGAIGRGRRERLRRSASTTSWRRSTT